jgi:hypothetical protein
MPSTHTSQSSKGSFLATYYGEFTAVSNKKCYFLPIRSHFKVEISAFGGLKPVFLRPIVI